MYLSQIIISGPRLMCNYRQHLCLAHLQSLLQKPSCNLSIIITTRRRGGGGGCIQQQCNSISWLLPLHEKGKSAVELGVPGMMSSPKQEHTNRQISV